jgi:hypothetical protein
MPKPLATLIIASSWRKHFGECHLSNSCLAPILAPVSHFPIQLQQQLQYGSAIAPSSPIVMGDVSVVLNGMSAMPCRFKDSFVLLSCNELQPTQPISVLNIAQSKQLTLQLEQGLDECFFQTSQNAYDASALDWLYGFSSGHLASCSHNHPNQPLVNAKLSIVVNQTIASSRDCSNTFPLYIVTAISSIQPWSTIVVGCVKSRADIGILHWDGYHLVAPILVKLIHVLICFFNKVILSI